MGTALEVEVSGDDEENAVLAVARFFDSTDDDDASSDARALASDPEPENE